MTTTPTSTNYIAPPDTGLAASDTSRGHERGINSHDARARLYTLAALATNTRPTNDAELVAAVRPLAQQHGLFGIIADKLNATIEHLRREQPSYRLALADFDIVAKAVDEAKRYANARNVAASNAHLTPTARVARVLGVEPHAVRDHFNAFERARVVIVQQLVQALTTSELDAAGRRAFSAALGEQGIRQEPTLAASRADWLEGLPRVYEPESHPRWSVALAAELGVTPRDIAPAVVRLLSERVEARDFIAAYWLRALRVRVAIVGVDTLIDPEEVAVCRAIGALARSESSAS